MKSKASSIVPVANSSYVSLLALYEQLQERVSILDVRMRAASAAGNAAKAAKVEARRLMVAESGRQLGWLDARCRFNNDGPSARARRNRDQDRAGMELHRDS